MDKELYELMEQLQEGLGYSMSKVEQILDNLIEQPDICKATHHPLGFIHLKLFKKLNVSLRLHIWQRQARKIQIPAWLIHNHIFDLKSYVLCGSINNLNYDVVKAENKPSYRIYEVIYDECESQLHVTDELVNCKLVESKTFKARDSYEVNREIFHTSTVELGQLTCTLVITSNEKAIKPKVIGKLRGESIYKYQRNQCDFEELRQILIEVKEKIAIT